MNRRARNISNESGSNSNNPAARNNSLEDASFATATAAEASHASNSQVPSINSQRKKVSIGAPS